MPHQDMTRNANVIRIGTYLNSFTRELGEIDATERIYYFRGGINVVKAILKDVEFEYEWCPRLSDLAYKQLILDLNDWIKALTKLQEKE